MLKCTGGKKVSNQSPDRIIKSADRPSFMMIQSRASLAAFIHRQISETMVSYTFTAVALLSALPSLAAAVTDLAGRQVPADYTVTYYKGKQRHDYGTNAS